MHVAVYFISQIVDLLYYVYVYVHVHVHVYFISKFHFSIHGYNLQTISICDLIGI